MEFIKIDVNYGEMNCYIVYHNETKEAGIIDPGNDFQQISESIDKNDISPKYILLTHSHGDHIGSIGKLKEKYPDLKVGIHKDEVHMLENPDLNLSDFILREPVFYTPDFTFVDGDEISLGDENLKVIHVPGHSPGGVCFIVDDIIFVGDVLFRGSVGRSDFYGGDGMLLIRSIKEKLMTLPDEIKVYPGHGPETTIGYEKRRNPFL